MSYLQLAAIIIDLSEQELISNFPPQLGQFQSVRRHKGKIIIISSLLVIKSHEVEHPARYLINNEKQILGKLALASMPHTAKLLDQGEVNSRTILVLQRVMAEDLNAAFIPACQVTLISEQILDCLNTLHSFGICHNDIRPHNFLWNANTRELTLIDFEYATPSDLSTDRQVIQYFCSKMQSANELDYITAQLVELGGRWRSPEGVGTIDNDIFAAKKIISEISNRILYRFSRSCQHIVKLLKQIYPSKQS